MQRIRSGNEKIHPSRSADAAIGLYTETSYGPKSPHVLIAAGLAPLERHLCEAYASRRGLVRLMSDWSREFDEPIPLPDGRLLRALLDAGQYIAELPAPQH